MIGNNFPELLGKKREKISDVSRATGISRTTLTMLYYGSGHAISFSVLEKLCNHFNCNVGDILYLKEEQA